MFHGRRRPSGPKRPAMRMLEQARQAFALGDYALASTLFQELAQGAEDRGMANRAGDLRLRVAQCALKLGDKPRAEEQARLALRLFVRAGRPAKVQQLLPRVVSALEEEGRHEEAAELKQLAEGLLGSAPEGVGQREVRGQLPGKCPTCGGSLRPDDVEWLDSGSAECPYCGGVVPVTRP
jgi:tetratricopeptide (TPR) repeat protein